MSTPSPAAADHPDDVRSDPVDEPRMATLRRAPRFRAFFTIGALVGIVLGGVLGMWVSDAGLINRWIYIVVIAAGTTFITVLVAGIWVVVLDRRSVTTRQTPQVDAVAPDASGA